MPIHLGNSQPPSLAGTGNLGHDHGHIQARGNGESKVHERLGYHYTSNGFTPKGLSPSKLLNTGLKWATLSAPARKLGQAIQGGHDAKAASASGKARYAAGALIKGLANITGGVAGIVSGAAVVGVLLVGGVLRLGAGACVGLGAAVVKGAALATGSEGLHATAGNWASKALDIITPSALRKGEQTTLSQEGAKNIVDRAQLCRICSSTEYRNLPQGYSIAKLADIPPSVLARGATNTATGKDVQLRPHTAVRAANKGGPSPNDPFFLTGDSWSALKVGVFKDTNSGKIILSIVGTELNAKRSATVKSDIAQTLGIKDSAFQDADRLVKAFVEQYGADNIEVTGHSLGGGLAQYAGIKHGTKVTAFNSMGLHVHLRNRLGADKLDQANVTHVNSSGDPLSQMVEHGRFGITASSQVGKRYVINTDHNGGHKMANILDGVVKTANGGGAGPHDKLLQPG
jgi:hypothetical protein